MPETKHTPLPWNISDDDEFEIVNDEWGGIALIFNEPAEVESFLEMARANAAFIVRAANNHDRLIEACKAWVEYFDRLARDDEPGDLMAEARNEFHKARVDMTRAAISAAEGSRP